MTKKAAEISLHVTEMKKEKGRGCKIVSTQVTIWKGGTSRAVIPPSMGLLSVASV
jgi:hypothetical protein